MAFTVKEVMKGSIAEEIGLKPGDKIIKINGEPFIDEIDHLFFMSDESLLLEVESNGEIFEAEIEKEAYEFLGVSFVEDLMGGKRGCRNKCAFCFVDQLPAGMRETLYFKDDDWRLSFMMGNYITLTNVDDAELDRIIARKTSPLYISVHATQADVREKLLGNRFAGDILKKLKKLVDGDISFHTQIVLTPGYNDGDVLKQTIADLASMYPYAKSIAVVPAGLTKHREGLAPLKPVTKEIAEEVISTVHAFQEEYLKEYGTRFVFASDEMYIRADRELPCYDEYEDFDQIENGVGLIAQFLNDAEYAFSEHKRAKHREISVATGVDFAPYLKTLASKAAKRYGVRIHVYPIINNFFGDTVTVSGLLTGQDIAEQLKGKRLGECLFISSCMLRETEEVFLDDMTLEDFQTSLNTDVVVVYGGYEFISEL